MCCADCQNDWEARRGLAYALFRYTSVVRPAFSAASGSRKAFAVFLRATQVWGTPNIRVRLASDAFRLHTALAAFSCSSGALQNTQSPHTVRCLFYVHRFPLAHALCRFFLLPQSIVKYPIPAYRSLSVLRPPLSAYIWLFAAFSGFPAAPSKCRRVTVRRTMQHLNRNPSGCYVSSGSPIAARTASMPEAGAPPAAAQKRGFGSSSSKR